MVYVFFIFPGDEAEEVPENLPSIRNLKSRFEGGEQAGSRYDPPKNPHAHTFTDAHTHIHTHAHYHSHTLTHTHTHIHTHRHKPHKKAHHSLKM